MTEPSVQVPVSLIERAAHAVLRGGDSVAVHDELRALLSQPTPSAETCGPCRTGNHVACSGLPFPRRDCQCENESHAPAEPPSIPDMMPGTTFTAEHPDTGRPTRFQRCEDEQHAPHTAFDTDGGSFWKPSAVDPSTIRDVTPPES